MSFIQIEKPRDHVTLVTLNRPERMNAMAFDVMIPLRDALRDVSTDNDCRVVVLTGAGHGFCSGADLVGTGIVPNIDGLQRTSIARRAMKVLDDVILSIRDMHQPVIAAVNGPAAGAGFSLALACDTRIASEAAFFACAYGRIGASPDGGMTYFLPRVVGPSRATEILLNDPNMSAENALAERIVAEVVPPEELLERARAKAEKLASKAPHYVRMVKILCGQSIENSLTEHLQLERHGIADSMATEDLRAGVTAFFGGEEPEFSGS